MTQAKPVSAVVAAAGTPALRPVSGNVTRDPAAGDEHVFAAVAGIRLAGEAAVERLQLEAADVEEPRPLLLGCPPQGTPRAVVEGDVDPVVTYRVPVRVRYRLVLVLTVEAGGDLVVEGEGVPGKPATRPERGGGAFEVRRRPAQAGRCSSARKGQ